MPINENATNAPHISFFVCLDGYMTIDWPEYVGTQFICLHLPFNGSSLQNLYQVIDWTSCHLWCTCVKARLVTVAQTEWKFIYFDSWKCFAFKNLHTKHSSQRKSENSNNNHDWILAGDPSPFVNIEGTVKSLGCSQVRKKLFQFNHPNLLSMEISQKLDVNEQKNGFHFWIRRPPDYS